MKTKFTTTLAVAGLCLFAAGIYAGVSAKSADRSMAEYSTAPIDPKKKKAGEECKAADECQRHHSCVKTGEKSICTAPQHFNPPSIPNT